MKYSLILFSIPALLFSSVIKVNPVANNLSLTVYNNGLGMIEDERSSHIERGNQTLMFEGVPSSIIMESIIPSFSEQVVLYSQNYGFDTFSFDSVVNKSIGVEVGYLDDKTWKKGILLSNSPLMIKDGTEIINIDSPSKIKFLTIPEELSIKPSLFWKINSDKVSKINLGLKYLTNGISWNSNYVLDLTDKDLDLQGWITIINNSGVSYENADITCLAGEVNRVIQPVPAVMYDNIVPMKTMLAGRAPEVREDSFSGYHTYKIPFKETIKDKEQKQISFVQSSNIKYDNYGTERIGDMYYKFPIREFSIDNVIEFKNNSPLPAGIMRLYKKDEVGKSMFIGEQSISNIPIDEKVKLNIGKMFDIKGIEEIKSFNDDKYNIDIDSIITLKNSGKDETKIILTKQIPANGAVSDTCFDKCKKKQINDSTIEYTIYLKEKETYKFSTKTLISKKQ